MKTLYIECSMGAAGDMLTAALYELLEEKDREQFISTMNGLGLPGVRVEAVPSVKCGITGTHMNVKVGGEEEQSLDWNGAEEIHGHADEAEQGSDHEHHHDHHDHDHEHEHSHDHQHHHDHDHEHSHDHDHDHEHDHDHGHGHHHHTGMAEIREIIGGLALPEKVKSDVSAVFGEIAEAESHVHGAPVDAIHFHEVGSMDAVADVIAVSLLMDMISPAKICCSPVHVGSGQVRCAHGILPVPAPATAYILRGIPAYGGSVRGELCTPTGAALLKHFVSSFGSMPIMTTEKIGYGMGNKDFEQANCVRVLLGESEDDSDEVSELVCNLDDMTAEAVAFASEELFAAGALDVYTSGIGMKKGRQGTLFTCMCRTEDREKMLRLMFLHLTTLGIREYRCRRYKLIRSQHTVGTEYGDIRIKRSEGYGVLREKAEYEDLAAAARAHGVSLDQVRASVGERK